MIFWYDAVFLQGCAHAWLCDFPSDDLEFAGAIGNFSFFKSHVEWFLQLSVDFLLGRRENVPRAVFVAAFPEVTCNHPSLGWGSLGGSTILFSLGIPWLSR